MHTKRIFLVCALLAAFTVLSLSFVRTPFGGEGGEPAATIAEKEERNNSGLPEHRRRHACSSVGCVGCIGGDVCWACAPGYSGRSCTNCASSDLDPVGTSRGSFACIPTAVVRGRGRGRGSWTFGSTKKERIVTFVDSNPGYLSLLDVMLESVAEFSTRRTLVVGIGWSPKLKGQSGHVDTASIPALRPGMHVWFSKIAAMLKALETVDVAVLVEPDTVVSHRIDDLFDLGQHVARLLPHPLFPRHIHDIGQNILPRVGVVTQTVSPIHAHMIATKEHVPFLRRALELAATGRFNSDEHVFNVMLQIYDVRWTACLYDPFIGGLLTKWLEQNNDTDPVEARNKLVQGSYYNVALPHDSIGFVLVHGAKSAEVLREQFTWLKTLRDRRTKMYFDFTTGRWVESIWQLSNFGVVHTEETPLRPTYIPSVKVIPEPSPEVKEWDEVW